MPSISIIVLGYVSNAPNVWRMSPSKMLGVTTASEIFRQKCKNMRSRLRGKMRLFRKWSRNLIKSCRWCKVYRLSKDNLNRIFFLPHSLNIHSHLHMCQYPTQVNQASTGSFRTRQPQTSDTIRVLWEANKLSSTKRIIRSTVRFTPNLEPCVRPVEALESSTSVIIAGLF